ncbi:ABC transporter permease [Streptomyces sp. DH-12]|uniref:ABC transporter permease n=1 Tax=Streptomyces sp. DH-12 TaxID=2072509 RepID=UPI00313C7C45
MPALAGTAGLPYDPVLQALLLACMVSASFTITALSLALAVTLARPEVFGMLLGLVMMPLLFLSGAFFPLHALPGRAQALASVNPLAHGVDLLRRGIALRVPEHAAAGIEWFGRQPSLLLEAAALLTVGAAALAWAAHRFGRPERGGPASAPARRTGTRAPCRAEQEAGHEGPRAGPWPPRSPGGSAAALSSCRTSPSAGGHAGTAGGGGCTGTGGAEAVHPGAGRSRTPPAARGGTPVRPP